MLSSPRLRSESSLASSLVRRSARGPRRGFTLVEVLIVISIIAVLASLSLVMIGRMKNRANEALIRTEISNLANAIENYRQEEGRYPGIGAQKLTENDNQFPILYEVLAGKSSVNFQEERVVVENDEYQEGDDPRHKYRRANSREREDPKVRKYYLDQFGRPYIYRCNKGQKPKPHMKNPKTFDLYSVGLDGEDQTILGAVAGEDESDDITN